MSKGKSDIRTIYSDSQLNSLRVSRLLANYIKYFTCNLTDFLKIKIILTGDTGGGYLRVHPLLNKTMSLIFLSFPHTFISYMYNSLHLFIPLHSTSTSSFLNSSHSFLPPLLTPPLTSMPHKLLIVSASPSAHPYCCRCSTFDIPRQQSLNIFRNPQGQVLGKKYRKQSYIHETEPAISKLHTKLKNKNKNKRINKMQRIARHTH